MNYRNKKQPSTPSGSSQELLQSLVRQHEEIIEPIIALLLHTSAETEPLIQALVPKRNARVLEFPNPKVEAREQ